MKLLPCLVVSLLIAPICQANWQQDFAPEIEIEIAPEQSASPKPPVFIQRFANILANIGAIIRAPRDKQNVNQNVTGILANIIYIVLAASKQDHRSRLDVFTTICDELNLDQEMQQIIKQKIEEINQEYLLLQQNTF